MSTAPAVDIESIALAKGGHGSPEQGMCVMEAYCYVNRLPFSDRPACVCPVLAGFLRDWNDSVDDAGRQQLKRFLLDPRLGGTGSDGKQEARSYVLIDWALRDRLPLLLEVLKDEKAAGIAAELRSLASIKGAAELELAIPLISSALALDLALDLDLARALDLALARARDLALDLDLDLDLDLALARARALARASAEARDEAKAEAQTARLDVMERMLAI